MSQNQDNELLILTDENGCELSFEFLDMVEYEGQNYAVLLPVDDDEGELEILAVQDLDDNTASYESVEDDDVFEAVLDLFRKGVRGEE